MTSIRTLLRQSYADAQQRSAYALVALWLLAMIAFPIAYWTLGAQIIPPAITLAAIVQAIAAFYALRLNWGQRPALRALLLVAFCTWLAEFIGSKTGFPFGVYHYTDVLQPQIGGVPLLIPIAWFMLLPSAWAITSIILGRHSHSISARLLFAALSALVFTAWDLFLDPQMVSWNFWQWAEPVGYFGIPWVNYLGWLLVSGLVTALVDPSPFPHPGPLLVIYASVWFLQSLGLALFWGQPGPALFGSLAMGGFMLLAYLRHKQRAQS